MQKLLTRKSRKYFVLHEARLGHYGVMPHYSVYGPYTDESYARKIVRDLAQVHGGHVWRGMNEYTHRHYVTGLLNVHYVRVIPVPAYDNDGHGYHTTDSRGHTINLSYLAKKYDWS